jgi:hypothetical protein
MIVSPLDEAQAARELFLEERRGPLYYVRR